MIGLPYQVFRVLFIDDDPKELGFAHSVFAGLKSSTSCDWQVEYTDTPDSAIQRLATAKFDIVIVDLRLGAAISGIELIKTCEDKRIGLDVPFMILTNFPDRYADLKEAINLRLCHAFLDKNIMSSINFLCEILMIIGKFKQRQ